MVTLPDANRPALAAPEPWWRRTGLLDSFFKALCRAAALAVIALMVLLVAFLVVGAWPAITKFGFSFLFSSEWDPRNSRYGALSFIWGTLATSMLALVIAVPLGIGTATYLAEIAPGWVRRIGAFLIELLAAIPSVVYGFWGYNFLRPVVRVAFEWLDGPLKSLSQVPGLGWVYAPNNTGNGLVLAGLVLAIMVLPFITAITFDVCQAVPRSQREGALALGSTRWQMIWKVVLPYARPGIVGGCFLALGRALGETMAVVMLVGNNYQALSFSPLGQGASIASAIASSFMGSSALQKAVLIELGLVLLLVTVAINSFARLLIWRSQGGKLPPWLGGPRDKTTPTDETTPAPGPATPPSDTPASQPATKGLPENRGAVRVSYAMIGVLLACLLITLVPLFLILGYISYNGASSLNWEFFTNLEGDDPPGLGHAMFGTAMLVTLATAWAVPLAILAAIFLTEYKTTRLAPVVRFVGELLSGVPSIVIGLFAYALIVVPITGFSGWAGIFALGVMMIPIVMRSTEESLRLVPGSLRYASYALGAAHWQTVVRVVVPAALTAIVTGIFLSVARIAGETAPLLLTADHTEDWVFTPNGHTPFLTYYIYNWSQEGTAVQENAAWAAAFVLLIFVMALNVGIRLATGRRMVQASRAD